MKKEIAPLRVLVLEDTHLTLEHILELIRKVPYSLTVSVAASENEGIRVALGDPPDVAIIDLRLEQGNGFNVLRRLAELRPKPVAIVVTNFAFPRYREYALLNGAEYFLDKVRDLDRLPLIMESIAKKRLDEMARE